MIIESGCGGSGGSSGCLQRTFNSQSALVRRYSRTCIVDGGTVMEAQPAQLSILIRVNFLACLCNTRCITHHVAFRATEGEVGHARSFLVTIRKVIAIHRKMSSGYPLKMRQKNC